MIRYSISLLIMPPENILRNIVQGPNTQRNPSLLHHIAPDLTFLDISTPPDCRTSSLLHFYEPVASFYCPSPINQALHFDGVSRALTLYPSS